MNLYSGLPYWIVKNPLFDYVNPLQEDLSVEVAVVGAGITGSLMAHQLCKEGIDCCLIDKRSVGTGSSCASTALLQYEIDVPLYKMIKQIGEKPAIIAYNACLQSINDLEDIIRKTRIDADFERVPSVFYASNRQGHRIIKDEFEARQKYEFPVRYVSRKRLYEIMGIDAPGALMNNVSAQIDTYAACTGLIDYNMRKRDLKVYPHTEIVKWDRLQDSWRLQTADGVNIWCKYVVVAAGFEAEPFLPKKLMELTTTYAIISEPVDPKKLWQGKAMIWETREPYLYIRTDTHNRIIVGGEDESHNNAKARRFVLNRKAETLEKKFRKLMPHIPFKTEMSWAGTFSSTKDGLPLIGSTEENPNMLFALGYGGNGITFSVIASQVLTNIIQGKDDERAEVFSLQRPSL